MSTALSRVDIAQKILTLPPALQESAIRDFESIYRGRSVRTHRSGREPETRRRYARDPWAYARDVFGYSLTSQQDKALDVIVKHPKVLIPAANNVGKSWLMALVALWRFDCVGALEDPDTGAEQQGGRILLPGPDHDTIFETVYSKMLGHARQAESRGHAMPGERSEKSVLWRVPSYPEWNIEALSPPRSIKEGQQQAHRAAGRHHRNQHAIVEEGLGVPEALWGSVEAMCSGEGNTIVSAYNPTQPTGPPISREGAGYVVVRLSALDHPNVRERKTVVPGAVSHVVIDELVRLHCVDHGAFPGTIPDPEKGDFVYALAPVGSQELGPRSDGHPGNAKARLRVYRPGPVADVRIFGRTAAWSKAGLFRAETLAAATERWRATPEPKEPPSRVGCDPAREGSDDATYAPAWGDDAEALLRAHAAAQLAGPEAVETMRKERRARVGEIAVLPKGDGPSVATALVSAWPNLPLTIDDAGVGASVVDHARRVIGAQVAAISFGGSPPDPTPGEPWSENLRTAMYVRAALLVNLGLADVPPDDRLREELLAHELEPRSRSVKIGDRRVRVSSVLLCSKDAVKAKIGRSPDRADTFVLSLTEGPRVVGSVGLATAETSSESRARYGPDQGDRLFRR